MRKIIDEGKAKRIQDRLRVEFQRLLHFTDKFLLLEYIQLLEREKLIDKTCYSDCIEL